MLCDWCWRRSSPSPPSSYGRSLRTIRVGELHVSRAPPIRTEERKPAWYLACLAYRAKRSEGASDQEAHEAVVAAVQSVLPLPWKEASAEAVNAVAYATKYHSDWFWRGVSG